MKALVIVALALTAGLASAQETRECSNRQISCEGLEFTWDRNQGILLTRAPVNAGQDPDQLTIDVCAVRKVCGVTRLDDNSTMIITESGILLPPGVVVDNDQHRQQIRQQIAVQCQAVINSQKSNECYTTNVWNSSGAGLYNN